MIGGFVAMRRIFGRRAAALAAIKEPRLFRARKSARLATLQCELGVVS